MDYLECNVVTCAWKQEKKIRRRKATKTKLGKTNYGLDWKNYGVIWLVIHSVEANDIEFLISILIVVYVYKT